MMFRSSSSSPQRSIQLHIERLILDGLPLSRSEGSLVQTAVESELTRLLAAEGLAVADSRAELPLSPGQIDLTPDAGSRNLGRQIGGAVYHILNHSEQQTTTTQKATTL